MSKNDRSVRINFRVSPALYQIVQEAAAQDSRDLSGQLRKIVLDWAEPRIAARMDTAA
jgi:hypothetical protein